MKRHLSVPTAASFASEFSIPIINILPFMYSAPLYFADAQITDAFENLPIQNLCSSS